MEKTRSTGISGASGVCGISRARFLAGTAAVGLTGALLPAAGVRAIEKAVRNRPGEPSSPWHWQPKEAFHALARRYACG
ncbi:hypothetical protein [Streptomyces sp. AK08-02]|uniref:hypothetical protein n=1 Tax=Streptomyces sp. AK08-02 TaxID=3028654 RepID=UPI0029A4BB7B|nr:hypothetical protein [Streptomyces sp. AK08-02]MDX3752408.1 hypothetical protein [Streptomyces sp. AK08-02]